ncbi:MAG: glycoside hydrolase family 19 protein [Burkholderiales bacterium]|nr:hypothetical protein [Burkholderiales bacterium]MDE1926732.1 glycoside hydrolase family 19 protein [Burkholderiales bacterium]MDE2504104.1 glycoside hydrolase family 19 protein [Burkholderiales bacterium]
MHHDWSRDQPHSDVGPGWSRLGSVDFGTRSTGVNFRQSMPGRRFDRDFGQPFEITASLLTQMFHGLSRAIADTFVAPLNLYMCRHNIDTINRMAAFFGQAGHECKGLTHMEESFHYKEERLRSVFGAKLGNADVSELLKSQEALANFIYANEGGNGAVKSGDGWRFRGRGLLQLTLRQNYAAFAKFSGIDVVANPDLIAKPTYAVWSACWYWGWRRLNNPADSGDLPEVTRRINAKLVDLDDRINRTNRAREVLRHSILGLGASPWQI